MIPKTVVYPPAVGDPQQRARLLAALYEAQDEFGWLSPDAVKHVSQQLGVPVGQVRSTASFYTMLKLEPGGKYHIQICEGLSCYLVDGAETLMTQLTRKLNIGPGETTPDGRFSLEVVQCLASCGTAPVLRVNDVLYEHVTPESLTTLLDDLSGDAS